MPCVGAESFAQLGWNWTNTHAVLNLRTPDGREYRVAVPVTRVQNEASKELAAVGCHLERSVGAASVGGFFSSLRRAVKKVSRSVRRAIPKAVRRAARRVVRSASRAVRKVRRFGRSIVRSPALKAGLFAASFIPGAAAVTAPTLAAMQAADMMDRKIAAGERATRNIARGVRSLANRQAKARGLSALRGVKNLRRMARTNPAAARVLAALARKYRS